MLFIITGPSGSGKSSIVKMVLKDLPGTEFSVSHTTRPRRGTEVNGKDYFFIDRATFQKMIRLNGLAEWAEVHGHLYGTSRKEINKKNRSGELLLDIDVQGAAQIKNSYKEAVFVFIMPPSLQVLRERLQKRGENDADEIARRLKTAREEIKEFEHFDFIIVNDNLGSAVRELSAIITSRRCGLEQQREKALSILRTFAEEE
ncbi:MAG: guanylate kinase [Candidatus Aminicenantes bacterium]|nr:guanylate kinase [Candidatus Aminicenantes bacterium]